MNLLTVRELCKSYPSFRLQKISFALPAGRIMGLIGKNGAGKSTTLKGILNLVRPTSGCVQMFGLDFAQNEEACKQDLGVVLGETDFYRQKRLCNITAVTRRFYKHWDEAAYQKYLQAFALDAQKKVRELSSGMRVKYSIALALSHGAKLLILDEPTSGLDPVSRDDLLGLFAQVVKSGQRSILFSTHITSDLDRCADDITYIKDGQVLQSAPKAEFMRAFEHLKTPGETAELTLEEIMLRSERRQYDVEFTV